MKTYIKNTLLIGAVALGMTSCGENAWNDHLDGFVGGPDFSDVQTLDYTLTTADYENLVKNSANVAKAEADGVSAELTSVGKLGCFNNAIQPADYIPSFLTDPNFAYFTLSEGSAINITYKIAKDLPDDMVAMNSAESYTVTTADYQESYGSEENYAETFSPLAPATANLPRILKNAMGSADTGECVVVNYNNSETAPVFGSVPEEKFELSNTIKDAKTGDAITINGVVTAVDSRGFVVSDNSGSILYYVSPYSGDYAVGDCLNISGTVSAYNLGLQLGADADIQKVANASADYTYPAPKVYDGPGMDAAIQATDDFSAIYCQVTGTVSISGNYYNLIVDGTTQAQGSFYQLTEDQKAMLADGEIYTITGYFVSISKSGGAPKFFNIVPTTVEKPTKAGKVAPKVAVIANTATTALYQFNGTAWAPVSDVVVLQPADYTKMGVNGMLTLDQANKFIPMYLSSEYPYAAEETMKSVLYRTSDGYATAQYTFTNGAWENTLSESGVISETNQFVYKSGSWKMDPSISLVLPAGKNKPTSTWFYQAVVDWVNANIPDASTYVDSYGTAEYYSGCSAYQGNVNINAAYATLRGMPVYADLSDEELVATMKKRFESETGPGALSTLYPNMAPIGDLEPIVTIEFTAWTTGGANKVYTIIFKCTAKGTFEFVSCTWNDPE